MNPWIAVYAAEVLYNAMLITLLSALLLAWRAVRATPEAGREGLEKK